MKFEKWLVKQKRRDDPIGDLANDFIECQNIRGNNITIEESFSIFTPSFGAQEAYKEAKKEFNSIFIEKK